MACSKPRPPDQAPSSKRPESFAGSGHLLTAPTVESTCVTANPTSFAILFIAANNQLQSPSAEDDVLSSAGRDQIAADEDEREQHQDEIEGVHRQRTIMLRPLWSDKRVRLGSAYIGRMVMRPSDLEIAVNLT